MSNIQYCVWIKRDSGNLVLWRRCKNLATARYYLGVAKYKETTAFISTWERSEAFIKK